MANGEQASPPVQPLRLIRFLLLGLLALLLLLAALASWPSLQRRLHRGEAQSLELSTGSPVYPVLVESTLTPTLADYLLQAPLRTSVPADSMNVQLPAGDGAAFLSILEGGQSHLFAFSTERQKLLRLTMGDWDDITPAVSPDGSRLAFASNRSGHWDLYVMSLEDGGIRQLTNTISYEASPTWSPDGLWLAYEAYLQDEKTGSLDIVISPLDGSQEPMRLTFDASADFSPTWSPQGRKIAFVSSRSGDLEVWQADLDKAQSRFTNLSRDPVSDESHPAWSPDGRFLAWSSSSSEGVDLLCIWDSSNPDEESIDFATGSWPVWGQSSDFLLSTYLTPNQVYLAGYQVGNREAFMPLLGLDGGVLGISWGMGKLSSVLLTDFADMAELTLPAPWSPAAEGLGSTDLRASVVILEGVQAPYAMLQNLADESFIALRDRISREVGWDFLSVLEEAYVPLSSPLGPGYDEDWLYTGRAFKFNTAPLNAGWLVTVRENFGPETYWRVYLRAYQQDGSQGMPLHSFPFDLDARHSGDPRAYEGGGTRLDQIPAGYWIDFTYLASAYDWERLPSLSSWRRTFSGIRYNEYLLRQDLDWMAAMLEVYPLEALQTPTPVSSPTLTSTPTETPTLTPTLTRTPYVAPTITPTITRHPTATKTPKSPKE
jgi:TolB protein